MKAKSRGNVRLTKREASEISRVLDMRRREVTTRGPSGSIRHAIPLPDCTTSPSDLPLRVWARLFALAVDRLAQAKPEWAARMVREFHDLERTWLYTGGRALGTRQVEILMDRIFSELEAVQFGGRGHFKGGSGPTKRWLVYARSRHAQGSVVPLDEKTKTLASKLTRHATRTALETWIDVLDPPRPPGRPRTRK